MIANGVTWRGFLLVGDFDVCDGHCSTSAIVYNRITNPHTTGIIGTSARNTVSRFIAVSTVDRICASFNVNGMSVLERLDWHRSNLPVDELNIIAEAMGRFLDADGNRHAIGDLDELREAIDRVKAYQDFQPDKFDQRELNRRLRTLTQDREVRRAKHLPESCGLPS
jgi:hypothetical protein